MFLFCCSLFCFEKELADGLDLGSSYFGAQEGDFEVEIRGIWARERGTTMG